MTKVHDSFRVARTQWRNFQGHDESSLFLQRALIAVAVLLGSSIAVRTADAAQEFHMCDLFSIDDAAQLVGQPIVDTVEGGESSRFVCARYAERAATLLEVTRYPSADDARAQVQVGTMIAGLVTQTAW